MQDLIEDYEQKLNEIIDYEDIKRDLVTSPSFWSLYWYMTRDGEKELFVSYLKHTVTRKSERIQGGIKVPYARTKEKVVKELLEEFHAFNQVSGLNQFIAKKGE